MRKVCDLMLPTVCVDAYLFVCVCVCVSYRLRAKEWKPSSFCCRRLSICHFQGTGQKAELEGTHSTVMRNSLLQFIPMEKCLPVAYSSVFNLPQFQPAISSNLSRNHLSQWNISILDIEPWICHSS